jgi:hypothetical protein
MLMTLSDMLKSRATCEDGSFPVTEVFFDAEDGRLAYLALDTGGWFERSEVIVAAGRMGLPDPDRHLWPAEISRAELEAAPDWSGDTDRVPPWITALPPIVIGPFGNTYSPLMLHAMLAAESDEADGPQTEAEARVYHFERASRWRGRPVFGTGGELGRLGDLVFDLPARRLAHVVVESGGTLFARDARAVPVARLRRWVEGNSHLVLNLSQDEFEAIAPGLPER